MVMLDTCALIEMVKTWSQQSFSKKTITSLDEGACLFTVSFAEIACKVKVNKLNLGLSIRDFCQFFSDLSGIQQMDVSRDDWLDSVELEWIEKDPVDRLIVAYAKKNDLIIVTSDQKIKQFYKKVIW